MKKEIVFLITVLSWSAITRAEPLDTWTVRHTPVPAQNYNLLTFGLGRFLTVLPDGTVLTSTNGENWTATATNSIPAVTSVSFANNRFYIGRSAGSCSYSSDGTNWTWGNWPGNNYINDIRHGGGIYVTVSDLDIFGGNLSAASDGASWTFCTSGVSNNLYAIAYGAGIFVVVGADGNITTSGNGTNWTTRTSGTTETLRAVTYSNGLFVAVGTSGTILSSVNGASWNARVSGTTASLRSLAYGQGMFAAVGSGGTILTSTNGVDWISRSSGTSSSLNNIAFGNGIFVAVGDGTTILASSNGVTWTAAGALLTSVAYGATNFVAVGFSGTVFTSSNGAAWKQVSAGTNLHLYSVAYGNGVFAAVGQIILSSIGGALWTVRDSGLNYDFETVAFVNGGFLAVGGGGAMKVSSDGITWSNRASGTTATLYGVAYGNGLYVVTGAGGVIRTSPDGIAWTARASGTTADLNGVTFANGLFVVQGNAGVIRTSIDGMTWTARSSGTSQGLATSAYGGGTFVVVGLGGTILSSTNGINWTNRASGTSALLVGIAFAAISTNGSFVAVGEGGIILQSDQIGLPTAPAIISQPLSQSVACHSNAVFSVSAIGTPPLRYQWRRNGTAIPGATTNTYTAAPLVCQAPEVYSVTITNLGGSTNSASATLTVVDTNPPSITCPTAMVVSTVPGLCSATLATYTVAATDDCAVVSLTFDPPTNSVFQKGTNLVTCTAIDCAGNSNTCSFAVIVLDREAPLMACPTNLVAVCTGTNGAQVYFNATARDNCDTNAAVICTPLPGSYFGLGTNTVSCVCTDSSGNSNSCAFTIAVEEAVLRLRLIRDGTNVALSWPQSCAQYLLEQKSSLDPAENWSAVGTAPVPSGTDFVSVIPLENSNKFFRLRKQ